VAPNPGSGIRRWHDHPPGADKDSGGAPAQRGHRNVLPDQIAGGGHAGLATRDLGFAAIMPLRPDKRDPTAQPGIIMHMDVIGHAETRDEVEDGCIVAKQMMHFNGGGAFAPQ
jgi:hypothetical protein